MTSVLEPTSGNVLLCGILLIVSGVIILSELRKFNMRTAFTVFSILLLIIGFYIPFYFLGTLAANAFSVEWNPSFTFYFLQEMLAILNAPFIFFESVSFIFGLIAMLMVAALVITVVVLIKVVIKAIVRACYVPFSDEHYKKFRFANRFYIPNYHNTYLVTRRLRN